MDYDIQFLNEVDEGQKERLTEFSSKIVSVLQSNIDTVQITVSNSSHGFEDVRFLCDGIQVLSLSAKSDPSGPWLSAD